ncbi:MAG: PQQ-binding-like beta-propeller repeat protein [Planctomycetaceae bacterium]|nr:PQQ-binding-like beta-propeller repeat protein [Planctomycetaceae bacterium]
MFFRKNARRLAVACSALLFAGCADQAAQQQAEAERVAADAAAEMNATQSLDATDRDGDLPVIPEVTENEGPEKPADDDILTAQAAPAPARIDVKEVADATPDAPEPTPAAEPAAAAESAAAETGESVTAGDWPMWGGAPGRNMVNATTGINLDFDPSAEPGGDSPVLWVSPLGSQTYGNPVIADGRVYVGTNNGGEYRPKHKGDRGVLLCFDSSDGKMLWQLTREKLEAGRVNDWPEQGICSTPCVEGNRLYIVTNRCEVMCVDTEGFHDGENDGPFDGEVDNEELDADIVWSVDMMDELGVFPHNLATSSPVILGDLLLLVTSNGVDEAHLDVPSPRAACFIAVNKNTGEVVWEDSSPGIDSKAPEQFATILHGQWSSPAVGEVNGKAQVFMPGGDGILYSFDAVSGELIWWFDLNPKDSTWELGGRGTRNNIISTPVFVDNSVILSVGQDPEHGESVGHVYRIDATKTGDISPQIADENGAWVDNDNSGQIWHFGGIDADGSITGEKDALLYRRTISTAAVSNGLVYVPDLSGFLHCIDFGTGQRYWEYDVFAAVWGSPMVVDGHVLLGDEDGEVVVLKEGKELKEEKTLSFRSSIYSTPSIANGVMYVTDRSRLYAIKVK